MTRCAEPCRRLPTRWVACALVAAVVAAGGCNSKRTASKPGGATNEKADRARKLAEIISADAVKSSAAGQAQAVPGLAKGTTGGSPLTKAVAAASKAPAVLPPVAAAKPSSPLAKVPPRPSSPVLVTDRVSSAVPYATAAEAEEDALNQAVDRVEQRLRELSPPVHYRPSAAVVRNEYVRRDTRTTRKPNESEAQLLVSTGYSPDRVYVEFDVQLTADQVRELRTQSRVGTAVRVTGVVAAVILALALFLRLDEWTRGYLTSWLAVGAVLLGGAVAAAVVFV